MIEEVIKKEIKDIKEGNINSDRIISYIDYRNQYAILKSKIYIDVELKRGIKATIDITDLFQEELK